MSWRSVSAFDGGDNAAPAHIGPHLSRQGATPCTFGQPLRTFHSCRSAHEDNTGRRTAQKSALDVGEPATQCTGEGGRAVHGQGERRAHQFLHLDLCPPRWLFGHPPYFASRKAGSLSVRRVLKAPCDHKPRTSLCGRFQLPGVAPPSSELPTSSKMSRTTTTDTLGKTTCYAKTALTHPCATGPWVILPRVIKAALCSHCDVRRSQGAHGGWAPGPWAWPESSSAGRGCCRRWWPCSHVHPAKPAYAR